MIFNAFCVIFLKTFDAIKNIVVVTVLEIREHYLEPLTNKDNRIYRISLITLILNAYLLKKFGPVWIEKYIYIGFIIYFTVYSIIEFDIVYEMRRAFHEVFSKECNEQTNSNKETSSYQTNNTGKIEANISNPFFGKTRIEAQKTYHKLSKRYHPDQETGDAEIYAEINKMYDEFKKSISR